MGKKKITNEVAEEAMDKYVEATAQLQVLDAEVWKKQAELNSKYEPRQTDLKNLIAESENIIQVFFTENRAELLPNNAKSTVFRNAKVGFRKSPPRLGLLKGYSWDSVKDRIKKLKLNKYLNTHEVVDKNNLLKDSDELGKKLEKCGVEKVQDEKFTIKI